MRRLIRHEDRNKIAPTKSEMYRDLRMAVLNTVTPNA
jgi:hypothetical protein